MSATALQIARVVLVVALMGAAAALATPKGRLPLALRGVQRILRRDRGLPVRPDAPSVVSTARRLLAFVLVLGAVVLALV